MFKFHSFNYRRSFLPWVQPQWLQRRGRWGMPEARGPSQWSTSQQTSVGKAVPPHCRGIGNKVFQKVVCVEGTESFRLVDHKTGKWRDLGQNLQRLSTVKEARHRLSRSCSMSSQSPLPYGDPSSPKSAWARLTAESVVSEGRRSAPGPEGPSEIKGSKSQWGHRALLLDKRTAGNCARLWHHWALQKGLC